MHSLKSQSRSQKSCNKTSQKSYSKTSQESRNRGTGVAVLFLCSLLCTLLGRPSPGFADEATKAKQVSPISGSIGEATALWKRSCRQLGSPHQGLCLSNATVSQKNTCSGTVRQWRAKKRRRGLANRARRQLEVIAQAGTRAEKLRAGVEINDIATARLRLADDQLEEFVRIPPLPTLSFSPAKPRRTKREQKRFREWLSRSTKASERAAQTYQSVHELSGINATLRLDALVRTALLAEVFADRLEDVAFPAIIGQSKYRSDMEQAFCSALENLTKPLRERQRTRAKECHVLVKSEALGAKAARSCALIEP